MRTRPMTELRNGRVRSTAARDILAALVPWIQDRLAPEGVPIGPDTELFSGGLIDSMKILLLIAWTERAIGHSIPDEQIRMDNFETPRRIVDVFCEGG